MRAAPCCASTRLGRDGGTAVHTSYGLAAHPSISRIDGGLAALASSGDAGTALTNLMTGRPARGVVNRVMHELGPMGEAPEFPLAAGALAPLRAKAEAAGSGDFSPMWSGQAAALGHTMPAGELTRALVAEAQAELRRLGGR